MQRPAFIRAAAFGLGLLAIAGLALLAVSQQNALSRLRDQQREDAAELERLRAETRDLPRLRAEESEIATLRDNASDVLRLRGENRRLRDQQEELGVLQAANARLLELVESFPLSTNQSAVVAMVRQQGAVLGISAGSAVNLPGGGVVVTGVEPNSPAARSGLRAGDQILRLDGKPIDNLPRLQIEMLTRKPGETVWLDVLRDGAVSRISVDTIPWPQQLAPR